MKMRKQQKTTMDKVCSGEESQNGGEELNDATEDGGTETDKQDKKTKSDAIGPNTEQVTAMNMKIWICENCSVVPKKTDKILKHLLDLQQELKSLKSNVEEILKTQKTTKAVIPKQRRCHLQTSKRRLLNLLETTPICPPTPLMMIAKDFVKKRTASVNQNAKLLKRTYF